MCGVNISDSSTKNGINVTEDIYGYDMVEAFQFTSDIQVLNQQTNYYIDGYEKGTIGAEEFTENINELADKYGELDIDFLQETEYYDNMSKGVQDTKDALYAMSDAVSREDGKTLNQSTSRVIVGQKQIIDVINKMNEDLKEY